METLKPLKKSAIQQWWREAKERNNTGHKRDWLNHLRGH